MRNALVLKLALIAIWCAPAQAGNCGHFFQQQVVVAAPVVAAPVVLAAPVYYQAGRDIEAEALAEKVARRVIQQLKVAPAPAAQQSQTHKGGAPAVNASPTSSASALATHCAKCHSGAAPKAGIVYDGQTQLLCSQVTAGLRAIRDDSMPKDHKIAPEIKGQLMEELLNLERSAAAE